MSASLLLPSTAHMSVVADRRRHVSNQSPLTLPPPPPPLASLPSSSVPLQPRLHSLHTHSHHPTTTCQATASTKPSSTATTEGDIAEVKALKGIRVIKDEEGNPKMIEYLVEWKDGSSDTWEPATNLADNLLRDYESRWWTAVRKADEDTINEMVSVGGPVLARTIDDGRRSALHFAAALGKADLVTRLLQVGAEVDLADKDGYTPLHMAAGYLHTSTINALLAGGADPEQKDIKGRSPLELVESLRAGLPADNPATVNRRVALEDVLKVLTENLFEDVEPEAVLDCRDRAAAAAAAAAAAEEDEDEEKKKDLEGKEYLIKFADEEEPVWLAEKYVSPEVIEDFEAGMEYAEAVGIVGVRNRGDTRTYLVRWSDGYPDSWENEENVSPDLIRMFELGDGGGGGREEGSVLTHSSGSNGTV